VPFCIVIINHVSILVIIVYDSTVPYVDIRVITWSGSFMQ
jgi:hypothetical protein